MLRRILEAPELDPRSTSADLELVDEDEAVGRANEVYVPSAISTAWGVCFVMPSIRDAVFTVSPITAYSKRRSEPTLPDITGPELIPIPIRNPSSIPEAPSQELNEGSFSLSIERAAATARSAWSCVGTGAPNAAITPSPM